MRITHYMTIDVGTGPVSLIEIRHDEVHDMLRITHKAAFNAVATADPEKMKAYVAGVVGAKSMNPLISPEHEEMIGDEIARWGAPFGLTVHKVRWRDGKEGKILATREDLEQYDAANMGMATTSQPKRSTRIML